MPNSHYYGHKIRTHDKPVEICSKFIDLSLTITKAHENVIEK